jgi:hypothetical protein
VSSSLRRLLPLALLAVLVALVAGCGGANVTVTIPREAQKYGSVINPTPAAIGALAKAENLNDLASASTARTNLGLGSMAVESASTFAPVASPALTGIPKAPTAAAKTNTEQIASTAYVKTAREEAESASLGKTENLSGLTSPTAAVEHLGLVEGGNSILGKEAAATEGTQDTVTGNKALATGKKAKQDVISGYEAGEKEGGERSVEIGPEVDKETETGSKNVNIGAAVASKLKASELNTLVGTGNGHLLEEAERDTAIGAETLDETKIAKKDTAIGFAALTEPTEAIEDTVVGNLALIGKSKATVNEDIAIGTAAGKEDEGSKNVFLGYKAGEKEKGSSKLYIADSPTVTPLIFGNFETKELTVNGLLTAGEKEKRQTLKGYVTPGEASPEPAKPTAENEVVTGEESTVHKQVYTLLGNGSAKEFKLKHTGFKTRMVLGVVQKATSEKAGEEEASANYTIDPSTTEEAAVKFTVAPGAGTELFVTLMG